MSRVDPPAPDPHRYQWIVGGVGLALVVAFSLFLFVRGGEPATPGLAAGARLHRFVAPLAGSDLEAAVNADPRCDPRRPARRGLNVCGRGSLVLAFFVLGARPCEREVDALQRVSRSFPDVTFAAVAVGAGRDPTALLARRQRWTIPIAYDITGVTGKLYRVAVCPLVELVRPGGVIGQRLIGDGWTRPARLAAAVRHSLR